MRDVTSLPHEKQFVGTPWNPQTKTGNFDTAGRVEPDIIILHSMDGTLDGSTAWFRRPGGTNSAHYGLGQDGRLVAWIPENCVAYHAGKYEINKRAIGIECEDFGNNQAPRSDQLYQSVARLVAEISLAYGIPLDREHVKKHNEIVPTSCPGTLDIDRILREATALVSSPVVDEPLHNYQLKPTDFVNMVTKSSEYDEIWRLFRLDPNQKINPGSHKLLVDEITRRVNEATLEGMQNGAGKTPESVPLSVDPSIVPLNQSKSLWKKDVLEVLTNILHAVRRPKAV